MGSTTVKGEMGSTSPNTNNLADPVALGKIDGLFACGVGDYIALPQLVVVGDQSSGKSSVLQAFIDLPFPRDSGLCTRFATQVMFRRDPEARISVSIIPGKDASLEHKARVKDWAKLDMKHLNAQSFAQIMNEVHEVMGLGGQDAAGGKATFSEDVLRLEVVGPDQEHFSVVDVPGIFRKTTEGVTTTADRDMVKSIVCEYMQNPRSVMLAVVPANVDIATQEILTLAEEYDPGGNRTLGVLTKPDLVDTGAEGPIMGLVEGKRHKLSLGWFIVRNPGQKQLDDPNYDRNAGEKHFFRNIAPWNSLDKDKAGVEALRLRLQEVLAAHIRKEFPKVKIEINKQLAATKEALKDLGAKRSTAEEQRQYLMDMSMRFQEIANHALLAHYVSNDWFDEHWKVLRFATLVQTRNHRFSDELWAYGQSYQFDSDGLENSSATAKLQDDSGSGNDNNDGDNELIPRQKGDHEDLEEVTGETSKPISKIIESGILAWLELTYRTSRGFELGTFDSSLLATTFKTQSTKWEALTLGYIYDVITMAHEFIETLLGLICADRRVLDGLMSILMEDLISKYKDAIKSARFLLRVERMGTPSTMNHYFSDNLEKARHDRIQKALKEKSTRLNDGRIVVELDSIQLTHSTSNEENIVQVIHDILKSYYKVARKRFADDVVNQAGGHYLVWGPDTPLKLFSPSFVSRLDERELQEIAGEDAGLQRRRAALVVKIEGLERGRRVLR